MADVRFEHVTKRYVHQSAVISDLSLEIADGEFMVLVGPSGCGKSTALRMIAGLEEISDGDLYIGDRLVNEVPPKDRDVAMVFQNYALYPHMSVFDNMAFALRLRGVGRREIQRRVGQAAAVLGLTEYLERKPRALSGGQRQRVALGRALVREPKVFLLDEPLSNLDAKLRVQTRTEIAKLHQQTATTFVYVTHDQVEAMTMGDRIAVLNAGTIQHLGSPQQLYDAPANIFVASFIGSPAMNFFSAQLVRRGDAAVVQIGGGTDATTLEVTRTPVAYLASQATPEGRSVIVGIRPENLHLTADDGGTHSLPGTIEVVEHLGNEQLIHVLTRGAITPDDATQARELHRTTEQFTGPSVVARVDTGTQVSPGDRVALRADIAHVHVFDPMTTRRFA